MKTEELTQREQAIVAEIKAAIAEIEPRRRWLLSPDMFALASLTLVGAAAYHLFL